MPHLTTTPSGTPVDLDTARGQYEYLGEFLVSHGAPSTTLGLLTQLYRAAKDSVVPEDVVVSREDLRRWFWSIIDKSNVELYRSEVVQLENLIAETPTSPAADQPEDEVDICGHDSRYPEMGSQPKPSCPEFPDNSKCAPIVEHGPVGILPLVIHDMKQRGEMGMKKYGRPLTANNGRDALRDAYEEAMDLCQYLRQAIEERGSDPAQEGGGG